jgi:hypothetical protein
MKRKDKRTRRDRAKIFVTIYLNLLFPNKKGRKWGPLVWGRMQVQKS